VSVHDAAASMNSQSPEPQAADAIRPFDPVDALARLEALDDPLRHREAWLTFFRRWAERDGAAAVRYALEHLDESSTAWDAAALAFEVWMARDWEGAAAFLPEVHPRHQPRRFIDQLVAARVDAEPQALAAWVETLPIEHDLRAAAESSLALVWGARDADATAAWLDERLARGEAGVSAPWDLVRSWAAADAPAAARWAAAITAPEHRKNALTGAVTLWAERDVGAADDFLRALPPGPELDHAVHHFARALAPSDPAAALAWTESIHAHVIRELAALEVLRAWRVRDPAGAAAWLTLHPPAPWVARRL
jgi:hypothetical protein